MKQAGKKTEDIKPLAKKIKCFTFSDGIESDFDFSGVSIDYHKAANKLFRKTGEQFDISNINNLPEMYAKYFVFTKHHSGDDTFFINENNPAQVMVHDGDTVNLYKEYVVSDKKLEEDVRRGDVYFKNENGNFVRGSRGEDRYNSVTLNNKQYATYRYEGSDKFKIFIAPSTLREGMSELANSNNVSPEIVSEAYCFSSIKKNVIIKDADNNVTAFIINDVIGKPYYDEYIGRMTMQDLKNEDATDELKQAIEWYESESGQSFDFSQFRESEGVISKKDDLELQ
jgi:hypothetical protein